MSALSATSCIGSETSPAGLMDVQYNFNVGADNGNLVGITNNRNSNRSQGYGYDALNRITSAATLSTCTANCWNLAFTLDPYADLTAIAGTGNATLTPNANNQIGVAPFTYDASGNELTDVTDTYTWNAESEMKAGGGVTYLYDGKGRRVEKSGTKLYWYGPSDEVLDETDTTGSTSNAAFSEYIYFAGERLARRDYLNNVYYYFEDQIHSSRVIAEMPEGSTTPTLCYDADFYPYGGEIDFTNTCAQNYKFDGKERDPETGNDYFGARFYSSAYGRFLSPDWSSIPAAVPYANLTNPQTLNLYAFVNDNPESFADLDGHDPTCASVNSNSGQPASCSQTTPPPHPEHKVAVLTGQGETDAMGGKPSTDIIFAKAQNTSTPGEKSGTASTGAVDTSTVIPVGKNATVTLNIQIATASASGNVSASGAGGNLEAKVVEGSATLSVKVGGYTVEATATGDALGAGASGHAGASHGSFGIGAKVIFGMFGGGVSFDAKPTPQ